ncbi:ion channel [Salinarimonas sp.]|uniref:ion channel n=1 Tax=Salinarimonas sp. TaxID=2766526 RepID=UPI0032D8B78A
MRTGWLQHRKRHASVRPLVRAGGPRRALPRLLAVLATLALLHVGAMMALEGLGAFEAVWLTLTTLTTVGYGDLSARTPQGRLATMLLVFLGGIWIAFQSAATYFELRGDRRERKRVGRWRWDMRDHILVLNVEFENAPAFLAGLVAEFRASRRFHDRVVELVSPRFATGLPEALSERGVVHVAGEPWSRSALEAADAQDAEVIVVLALDDGDAASDGRTFDIVDRLREMGAGGRIIAECVDDANRPRMVRAGADVVVRPLRGYPEMIVRALAAPGAEAILEDLFTSRGDECWRYDVEVSGRPWREIVRLLTDEDIGVPIAYRAAVDGRMVINPPPKSRVEADKLFVLVREGNARSDAEIAALLRR